MSPFTDLHNYNFTNNDNEIKIAAGIVFFDDAKGLERCLNSIHSFVDIIIAIDGKFKEFDDDHDISIDGSKEVIQSFQNAKYYSYPNLTQIEKRNKYLEIAGNQGIDFLFVIDSDEYASADRSIFRKNLEKIKKDKELSEHEKCKPEVYGVKIFERHVEKMNSVWERYIERLFYKPGHLRYSAIHSNLVDVNDSSRNFTTGKYTKEIDGFTLYNDDNLRDSKYLQKSLEYQNKMYEEEEKARRKIMGF